MVFYLAKSIVQTGRTRGLTDAELDFFAKMASAHRDGFCYLCGDVETLDYLYGQMGPPAKGNYLRITNSYPQHGRIIDAVSKVFVLTMLGNPEQETLPETLTDKDRREFLQVSDAISRKWGLNLSCCLLTENDGDGVFYQYIANYWLDGQESNFRNMVQCHVEYTGGGGDTTGQRLATIVRENSRPLLCIVDTDWKYGTVDRIPPTGGKTWSKADRKEKALRTSGEPFPPFQLFPLRAHEAENLIPMDFLKDLLRYIPTRNQKSQQYQKGLDMLNKLKTRFFHDFPQGSPALYYDLKEGIPYIPDSEPQKRRYWEIVLSELSNGGGIPCQKPSPLTPLNQCFPPLNQDILKLANQRIFVRANQFYDENRELPQTLSPELPGESLPKAKKKNPLCGKPNYLEPPLNEMWLEIGYLLFTWGCAAVDTTVEQSGAMSFATRF